MSNHDCLKYAMIPELGMPRKGKVRDIYEQENTLTLITSDRISVFDRILNEPIQDKGTILTALSVFWFEHTKDIVPNHLIGVPDPNVITVKRCRPFPIEMVVRSYLVGSIWKDYAAEKRIKCGVPLPDGLQKNSPLPHPILTPTTKNSEGHDQDTSKEELIEKGVVTPAQWKQLTELSLNLFKRGQEILSKKGMILVDTKYEFGLDSSDQIILIDEIHTPDSSRFWFKHDQENNEVRFPDKEFAREWSRSQNFSGDGPVPAIPEPIRKKIREGYVEIYEQITGQKLSDFGQNVPQRILKNLKKSKIIKGKCALLFIDHQNTDIPLIQQLLEENQIPYRMFDFNNYPNKELRKAQLDSFNDSLEPLACLALLQSSHYRHELHLAHLQWPILTYAEEEIPIQPTEYQRAENPSFIYTQTPTDATHRLIEILNSMELTT